ncbi:MAG: sigma-54-dependent Fis family transcriptional regulator [Mailhella sp.]|nr:sigma-54-dependent Fis family transcriptional regulator [Mailhella sp.]
MDDLLSEQLLTEWEKFQNGKEVNESIIRPNILRSWIRCRQMNVDPDMGNRRRLDKDELAETLQKNTTILNIARGIMEKLYTPIASSGSIISFADINGVILHSIYDIQKKYPIPNIVSGSIATESSSGSNAISLCLEEKRTVETRAAEHYCRSLHGWFCCASPIWNPRNEMVGILNVTLPWKMYHQHTMGMVESSAHAISEQIRLHDLLKEQRTIFEMIDEGLIVLERDGRIRSLNHKAQLMLALSSRQCWLNIEDIIFSKDILQALLADNANFHDQEAQILLKHGLVNCMLSVVCMSESGTRIVTLREVRRVKESATRIVGAKAVFNFKHIVGESQTFQAIVQQAKRAARSDSTVLLLGESGTGKELFAQAIYNSSIRATEAFITVNCGALPRELVQSELFGYDEGAFTGASRLGKPGKFELADGGTIFLDEIGEMPLDAQVSLLRLLQNGEVTRVGSKYTKRVNVRVIAATNRNLLEAIQDRSFREDLYFRLNVIPLNIPPLRERINDIPLLVQHFLQRFRTTLNNSELRITDRAMQMLEMCSWPGNIRELENAVERMAFMAPESGIIDVDQISATIPNTAQGESKNITEPRQGMLELIEKENIIKVLKENGGNIRLSARLLGISRSGLYVKMKRYGISLSLCRA